MPQNDVKILGVGIFGPRGDSSTVRPFDFGYKFILKEAESFKEIYNSETYEEVVVPPLDETTE